MRRTEERHCRCCNPHGQTGVGNGLVDEVRVRVLVNWEGEEEEETRNQTLLVSVRGMTCAACSTSVEMALKRLPAVMTAAVTLIQENAEIL